MLATSGELWAQLDPVSLSLQAYQAKDYEKARELIETAVGMEKYATQARPWYFRAYIYKDLYKEQRASENAGTYRKEAIDSYFKTIEYDVNNEFTDDCKQSIKFLATTIYNESAANLDANNFEVARKLYTDYKEIWLGVIPDFDFRARDIEFDLYMASKYSVIFDNADINNKPQEISDIIVELYKNVLLIDSNNISANYNLGIHFYNQGVNIIENIDYNEDFEIIFAKQEKVIELFEAALPYMLKAYELDPYRKEVLQGLSGIYYGLSDMEKSEYYQTLLEKLEQGK